jgi:hypothetical protein
MFEIAQKTHLVFEPGESKSLDLAAATGNVYATPAGNEILLEDLARLSYLKGKCKYRLRQSGTDAAAVVTLSVKNGSTKLGETTINFDGSGEYAGTFDVDLSEVAGTTKLKMDVNVDTQAGAGITATLAAVLDVAHPLVLGGCG